MKSFKKLGVILSVLAVVFALGITVFAAGSNTITVNTGAENENYSIYKMLNLSVDTNLTAYRYTVVEEWNEFFTSGAGKDYVTIDGQGYVTWKDGKNTEENMIAFGKSAAAYAKDKSVSAIATKTSVKDTSVVFDNLDSGYFLITSTLGTKVIVQTTPDNPAPTINEKNALPTVEKYVKEDSTGDFGKENTAQIGDKVEFKTVVKAKSGAKKYVLHDKMEDCFAFDSTSVKVSVNGVDLALTADYTVNFSCTDGCTFEITFTQTYLDTLTADTDINVFYSAVLNEKAKIYNAVNKNVTHLTYGENDNKTADSETETKTFKFDIVKTDKDKKGLNGAKFELYDAKTGGNKIALVKESDGSYRIATDAEKNAPEGFTSAVIEAGTVTVKGADADTKYYLEETEAPVGYNKLADRQEIAVVNDNLSATFEEGTYVQGGVQVINNTGNELPSTGGIGTTVFYCVGGVLVIGAIVLLIAKKRMSKYE